MSRAPRAFTLIELLAAIAIIAVLAAIVIGAGRHASEAGKTARTRAELVALVSALEAYKRHYGDYPRTRDAAVMLQSLAGRRGPNGEATRGAVLLEPARFTTRNGLNPLQSANAMLLDPWGNAYVYAYAARGAGWTNPSFVLYACGPDGVDDAALQTGYPQTEAAANLDNLYATP